MNTSPSTEERIWAVFSHLSALALGMGILLPIIGWSEQRRKSKYASFQCLQALGYQSLGYTVWALLSALIAIVFVMIMLIAMETGGNTNSIVRIWMAVFEAFIFGLIAIYFLPPLIAAISCVLGKDFRYPIMGNRLAKYLSYHQTEDESAWLIEEHEEYWVVAMGHFSVLIVFWGMLAPLVTWILHGKRSSFLKFQAIQTLIYQLGVTILYLGTVFIYIIDLILLLTMGLTGNISAGSPTELIGIIFLGVSLLVLFIIILLVPLLHILGQWAGYRVLKGDDYHYPIIGKLVERRMTSKTPIAADSGLSLKGNSS